MNYFLKIFNYKFLFAKSEKEEIKAYEKLILEQKIENIVLQNIKTNDKRIDLLNKYKDKLCSMG